MYLWDKNTNVIIFGSGELAKQLYYIYKGQYNTMFFVDNYKTSDIFIDNKKLFQYSKDLKQEYKIIIASTTHWQEISEQLIKDGFEPYEDFAPYWMASYDTIPYFFLFKIGNGRYVDKIIDYMKKGKEIAIIHGNCQTRLIRMYLEKNRTFQKKYIFLEIPSIFLFEQDQLDIIKYNFLWKRCSLFITQMISDNNIFGIDLSTNSIKKALDENCKTVTIPILYFTGYFPQAIKNKVPFRKDIFCWRDTFVDSLFEKGLTIDEIIDTIKNEEFLNEDDIEQNVIQSFNELERRETFLDIRISDYIKQYYKDMQLFYDPYHPCNFLLKELVIRILKFLQIQDLTFENDQIFDIDIKCNLREGSIPIYPSVVKVLNLKQWEKIAHPSNYRLPGVYFSFEEFIKKYIYVCLYD